VLRRERDGRVVRRLLALALILEGHAREAAASMSGMQRQTLRDWVHRYNEAGLAGLSSRVSSGPARLLSADRMEAFKELVIKGPDPEINKVVRWRCVDLREKLAERFPVSVHKGTVAKWLRELDLTRLQPRPFHPNQDAAAQVVTVTSGARAAVCTRRHPARAHQRTPEFIP
jgi:transposase